MKPWIHEEILKTWTDAQKRLWESLCSAVPFQPPAGVEAWRETYLKNLASWEAAVKRTLEKEAAWVEEWVQRVAREKGTPEMMASWVKQMEEVLHRWIQTQNQWWDDYFAVLRRGGLTPPDQFDAPPATVAESVSTVTQPAAVLEPLATVASPSAVSEPVIIPEPVIALAEAAPDPTAITAAPAALPEPLPVVAPVARQPDDLKLINGIGPALEKKLNACGVRSFRDLAVLGEADVERIEAAIKFTGRIHRENWIGQAKAQHLQKYQDPL
ncbi:hypothetical protein [Candidatus Contendibacter odensensis]|uniref:Uncharacterized protein n=1 Tax=Candidatus Contendobacter odensis Run_B_J11 TaxID=1400861 RepID=A0A7U7GFE5_9GAMM|nr:hypothetical protein [Candidatus Contendobacter odensis]CDH46906.1 hypothetical protein BN874_640024 [Candidatus Contendobacter odensis Run_B_J11]